MFLRDLGLGEDKFVTDGHGNHEGASIDQILSENPNLLAIFLGDTGQLDAQIYRDAISRHEGRVLAVGLHTPGSGLDVVGCQDLVALRATGVPCFAAPSIAGFARELITEHPSLLSVQAVI